MYDLDRNWGGVVAINNWFNALSGSGLDDEMATTPNQSHIKA